jgi:diguanylate cyclase (GGDEF)-like protein
MNKKLAELNHTRMQLLEVFGPEWDRFVFFMLILALLETMASFGVMIVFIYHDPFSLEGFLEEHFGRPLVPPSQSVVPLVGVTAFILLIHCVCSILVALIKLPRVLKELPSWAFRRGESPEFSEPDSIVSDEEKERDPDVLAKFNGSLIAASSIRNWLAASGTAFYSLWGLVAVELTNNINVFLAAFLFGIYANWILYRTRLYEFQPAVFWLVDDLVVLPSQFNERRDQMWKMQYWKLAFLRRIAKENSSFAIYQTINVLTGFIAIMYIFFLAFPNFLVSASGRVPTGVDWQYVFIVATVFVAFLLVVAAQFYHVSGRSRKFAKLNEELRSNIYAYRKPTAQLAAFSRISLEDARAARYTVLGNIDARTHLPNNENIRVKIADQLATKPSRPITVCFFDLNNFKKINETYLYQGGNAALAILAVGLGNLGVRGVVVARWGGDEFVGLFNGNSNDAVTVVQAWLGSWKKFTTDDWKKVREIIKMEDSGVQNQDTLADRDLEEILKLVKCSIGFCSSDCTALRSKSEVAVTEAVITEAAQKASIWAKVLSRAKTGNDELVEYQKVFESDGLLSGSAAVELDKLHRNSLGALVLTHPEGGRSPWAIADILDLVNQLRRRNLMLVRWDTSVIIVIFPPGCGSDLTETSDMINTHFKQKAHSRVVRRSRDFTGDVYGALGARKPTNGHIGFGPH